MKVTKKSMFSQKTRTLELDITPEQVANWKNGMLIQRAFPNLTISQREFMMTGAWDDEWDEAFPPELDDEGFIVGSTDRETFPNDNASHEVGMRLEDVSQDVKDMMTTTVFRSIMKVADMGEPND